MCCKTVALKQDLSTWIHKTVMVSRFFLPETKAQRGSTKSTWTAIYFINDGDVHNIQHCQPKPPPKCKMYIWGRHSHPPRDLDFEFIPKYPEWNKCITISGPSCHVQRASPASKQCNINFTCTENWLRCEISFAKHDWRKKFERHASVGFECFILYTSEVLTFSCHACNTTSTAAGSLKSGRAKKKWN